jgi:hypothetical protein
LLIELDPVPTPIQHIILAEQLLSDSTLPAAVRDRLRAQRGAFLFGNTAPDVQVVSNQPREATHFFQIPFDSTPQPHQALFKRFPALSQARSLPAAHAAFIVGYMCHLWLDIVWVRDIYLPAFGPDARWDTMRDRLLFHNILRAWCDQNDQRQLNPDTGSILATAQPRKWLPFTADAYLREWRDHLAEQFHPGATIRTVEVFAARNRVAPEEFHRVLGSPAELDRRVFAHAPREKIEAFYRTGHDEMAELIVEYFR